MHFDTYNQGEHNGSELTSQDDIAKCLSSSINLQICLFRLNNLMVSSESIYYFHMEAMLNSDYIDSS